MKTTLALVFCLGLAIASSLAQECPETEDVVWSLHNGACEAYRNQCHFDKANSAADPPLEIVDQDECQQKCQDICTKIYSPVSGGYFGVIKTFSNACEMRLHSCNTGETYV